MFGKKLLSPLGASINLYGVVHWDAFNLGVHGINPTIAGEPLSRLSRTA